MSSRAGFGLFGFRCSTKGTASKRRRGKTPKGFFSLLSVAPVNNSLPKGFMTADRYKNPMFSRVRSTFRAFDKNGVFDQTGIDSKGLSVFTPPDFRGVIDQIDQGKEGLQTAGEGLRAHRVGSDSRGSGRVLGQHTRKGRLVIARGAGRLPALKGTV